MVLGREIEVSSCDSKDFVNRLTCAALSSCFEKGKTANEGEDCATIPLSLVDLLTKDIAAEAVPGASRRVSLYSGFGGCSTSRLILKRHGAKQIAK